MDKEDCRRLNDIFRDLKKNIVDVILFEDLDSDYILQVIVMRVKQARNGGMEQDRMLMIWKLKDRNTRQEFKERLREGFLKDQGKSGVEEWTTMTEAIYGRTGGRKRSREAVYGWRM